MKRPSASAPPRAWKRALPLFIVLCSLVGILYSLNAASAVSPTLVISQVYGGGGNAGATYRHDFVEIFNRGTTAVSLNGYSIQYASATGTGNFGANATAITELPNVTLLPGRYFLVKQAGAAGAIGAVLPTADYTDTTPIDLSGTNGKVALAHTTSSLGCNGSVGQPCNTTQLALIVDMVGYGNANFFETTGVGGTAAAGVLSNTTAAQRKLNGCQDTDNNSADFTAPAPLPRNLATAANICTPFPPSVVSSSPANGQTGVALDGNITVNFIQDVTVTDEWFTLVCDDAVDRSIAGGTSVSGGPLNYTLNPGMDFSEHDNCTLTVLASQVSSQGPSPQPMAADYVATFSIISSPEVASTSPANGDSGVALDANIVVTFDQAVDLDGEWFNLTCGDTIDRSILTGGTILSGGPVTWGLNPATNFSLADTCVFDVLASQVTAQGNPALPMASDYSIYFEITGEDPCTVDYTPIFEIQGTGASAAVTGLVTTKGIVTASYEGAQPALRGYYLQDPVGDGNPLTSDGIFVFTNGATTVNEGDLVIVTATAGENQGQTQVSFPSATTICGSGYTVESTSVSFPVPAAVGGVDYLERFEGMLVDLPQTLYVTEMFQLGRFSQIVVSVNERQWQPTHRYLPGSLEAIALAASNPLGRIILDDALNNQNPDPLLFGRNGNPLSESNTLRGGDTVTGYEGILTFTWAGDAASGNAWRVRPIGAAYPNFQPANSRPLPIARTTDLRVTAMNLLNYFNTFSGCQAGQGGAPIDCRGASDTAEFNRQVAKTVQALLKTDADVIAISEIENDGHGPSSAIQQLVTALNTALGAPGTWSFVNPDASLPLNSLGSDAIKTGILYKPSKVTPVGNTAVLNSLAFVNGGDSSPRSRPALAQTFQDNNTGATFTVVSNHLKSKGSACNAPDAGDGQGNCNVVRTNSANALIAWLADYPTGIVDDDVLIVGDLNSYAMEDPIMAIKNAGYTDLAFVEAGASAYSYVFDGAWGYLDYSLASNSLAAQVAHATTWHINSDEPSILDYLFDFKSPAQQTLFYAPDEFRTSDHDPVLVDLELTPITHTLTMNVVGNGILSAVPTADYYEHNTVVTVSAGPAVGWHVSGWSGDCESTTEYECIVTMTAAKMVTATFAINEYQFMVTTEGNGSGSVEQDPLGTTFTHGTVVTLTATADANSNFTGWSGDCTGENPCVIGMEGDRFATATFELKEYTLTTATDGSGIGSIMATPTAISYTHGTTVTLLALADPSSDFVAWSGACEGSDACEVTMDANKTVTATFDLKSYTLYTDTVGSGSGTLSLDPAGTSFTHGTVVTVTATPNDDSTFSGWVGGCPTPLGNQCVFIMDGDKSAMAEFTIKTYSLITATVGSGSIGLQPDEDLYTHGTVVTVTAIPNTGYHLTEWSGDCTGTGSCVLTMDAAKSVTATFEINTYTLTTATVGAGTLSTEPSGSSFTQGTVVTVTATPDTGRHLSDWAGDCDSIEVNLGLDQCIVTMDAAKSVTATFAINFYGIITSTVGTGSGFFTIDPPTGPYAFGTLITITATPQVGSSFAGWLGDCSGTGACTFTITGNKSIVASFVRNEYALTTATDGTGSGTITTSPSGGLFTHGTVVTVTATADAGSHFAGWAGACTGTGGCVITMDAAKSVTATFDLDAPQTPITHTLTVALTGNGSGHVTSDPAGIDCGEECSISVESGSVVTLSVSISSGTLFSGFEGAGCGEAPVCAITVTANTLVTATFAIELYEVTVPDEVEGGTIDVRVLEGGAQSAAATALYPYGTALEFTAVPDNGYTFIGWTGDFVDFSGQVQVTVTRPINVGAIFGLMGEPDYSIFLPTVSAQNLAE